MATSYFLQKQTTYGLIASGGLLGGLAVIATTSIIINKRDPELTADVAKILYPAAGITSIFLSILLGIILTDSLASSQGHFFLPLFTGIGVAIFLTIRCLDIKFLRDESELYYHD